MNFIKTPLCYSSDDDKIVLERNVEGRIKALDHFVELVVFTPRGSFLADPDFGFEYWNHEYANVHYREFNSGHNNMAGEGLFNEVTKKECQESIRTSIESYYPWLRDICVSIELNATDNETERTRNTHSKYCVTVVVEGTINEGGLATLDYRKEVSFFMEPTAKRVKNQMK